ncbi:MAG TPA: hypothetical protein VFM94_10825, partial [Solirubrobacterales bacterium]|nr:hypothetical protein [Solirubrobacterales bacterium]
MDVGVALPNAVPGATAAQMAEWARRAESRGFSTLGTIDRIVYDNYEPLVALAAAAQLESARLVVVVAGAEADAESEASAGERVDAARLLGKLDRV